eukprot:Gregarina_sp_Pseudo_9__2355@NODE_2663_length_919_cov_32_419318_g2443_i0_p1_GENE_NODE_2663_length_919_cov_32_419318_g2443_i0NODE_2663_length_919_cov_32_419318_g2443_i0_p1_ORF_typecomplete_len241_score59_54_NODE_2663_length_919_cov_32_419318_g2443_i042764
MSVPSNVTGTIHHRQQLNETVAEFGERVRKSYIDLETWGAEYPQRAPVDRFLRGLRVPRCREFVFYRRPQTLAEAIDAAEQFSQVEQGNAKAPVLGSEVSTTADVLTNSDVFVSTTQQDVATSPLARRLQMAGVDPETQRNFEILLHDLGCHQVRDYDEAQIAQHMKEVKRRELEASLKYEHSTIVVIEYRGFRVLNLCKVRPAYPLFSIRVRNPKWVQRVFNRVKKLNPSVTVPSEILG